MRQRTKFVTLWRAAIAYPIAMAAGAMTFLPAFFAGTRRTADVVPGHGLTSNLLHIAGAELGVALLGLAIFSLPVFPFYVIGMIVARKLETAHWMYFFVLGIILSGGLWTAISLRHSHGVSQYSPYPVLFRLVMPVGGVAGLVCWGFLYLTCPRDRASTKYP